MTGSLADLDVRRADRLTRQRYERDRQQALRPQRCRCDRPMVERDELLGVWCVRCGHGVGRRR
jgi:hypothetical protein